MASRSSFKSQLATDTRQSAILLSKEINVTKQSAFPELFLLTTIAAVVLVGCGPSETDRSLLDAAKKGNIEAVKQYLDAGADVNAKGVGGITPLNYAVGKDHKEIAELLIAKGANVNAKNNGGETPLDWTIKRKQPETADLLRKHGGKTGAELKAEGK